jgi:ElaB/YqjD/DUF883 family membrane-anchored ribosome-binding protein
MDSERQGSRRPGSGTRPGTRPAGELAEQVELTVAEDGAPAEGLTSATGGARPCGESEVEKLSRALTGMQETARTAGLEAAREEARVFLRALERDLRAARIQERAEAMETLQSAAEEVASASQAVDLLLNEASTRADETTTLFQSACADVLAKLEDARSAAERLAEEGTARAEDQMKRLRAATDRAVEEARDAARAASWRPWVMATMCALVLILGVSILRPGWTMTSGQRRAERVWETVIRAYEAANPSERAEMRKVMGWRDPFPMDTAATSAGRR